MQQGLEQFDGACNIAASFTIVPGAACCRWNIHRAKRNMCWII